MTAAVPPKERLDGWRLTVNSSDSYSDFVDHPRYGRSPRFTRLRPGKEQLHYRLTKYDFDNSTIKETAVKADLKNQAWSPIPVLYYFDLKRICVDCHRSYIFFADEQKHWHESLGFSLDADCIRCVPCRKNQQGLAQRRQRYEELFHIDHRSSDHNLEMAECCLTLIDADIFDRKQTERIRMLLNAIPKERTESTDKRYNQIRRRLLEIESE